MLFTPQTAVFTLLTLASHFDAVSSQTFPFSIPSSSFFLVGPLGLNYTSFDELSGLGFGWDMVDANGVDVSFVWTEVTDATVELMSGPSAQALISSVMEPLVTGLGGDECNINLPANLPNGVYHMRVTSVVNTTIGSQTTIQTLTASGADLHWTRPNTDVGCGPGLQPNPFVPIKDVNDPKFTSFVLTSPYAGQNYPLSSTIIVQWGWRIGGNWGADISSAELQVLNATSGEPVLENAMPLDQETLEGFSDVWLHPVDLGLQENTQYRLQLKYVNSDGFPSFGDDGPIPPGSIVTHTGDVFNVVPTGVNCDTQNLLLDNAPGSSSNVPSSSAALPSSRPVASSSVNHVSSAVSTAVHSSSLAVSARPSASSAPVRPSSSISILSTSSNPVSNHPSSTPARPSASSAPVRPSSSSNIHSISSILSSHPSSPPPALSVSSAPRASSTGAPNPKSSAAPSNASVANNASPSSAPSSGQTISSDGQSNSNSGSASSISGTGNTPSNTVSSDPESASASPNSGSAGSRNDASDSGSGSGSSSNTDSGKGTSNAGSGPSKGPGGGHGDGEPKQCKKKHGHKYKHQKPHHDE
ncbi:hypothetical protein C8R45DRAFT_1011077 [Mycena sanguinolenta]|nr:hypothetical protein C8R45DRAFT_1011077 [Mycena sanguinolenta]